MGKLLILNVLTGCQYSLIIAEIIAEIPKMYCETANKISCIKTSIHFIKEGNVSKIPHRNRHKQTLLDGCLDWCIIADVDWQLAFPTKIT